MAGQIAPKNLFDLRPDWKALLLLARVKRRNAETLFSAIAEELARAGVELLPAYTFLEDLLAAEGLIAGRALSRREEADVAFGFEIAREVSRLDIGQTVVVKNGTVLAVEAFEGTDAAMKRGGALGRKGAIVVKVAKPNQDMRFDVPVIGAATVEVAAAAQCASDRLGSGPHAPARESGTAGGRRTLPHLDRGALGARERSVPSSRLLKNWWPAMVAARTWCKFPTCTAIDRKLETCATPRLACSFRVHPVFQQSANAPGGIRAVVAVAVFGDRGRGASGGVCALPPKTDGSYNEKFGVRFGPCVGCSTTWPANFGFAKAGAASKIGGLRGVLAQLVERLNGIEEVRGSIPLGSRRSSLRAALFGN